MRSLEKEEDVRSISTFEPPIIDFAKTVMLILVGRLACYQFARNIKCANPNPEVGMVKERFKVPRLNSLRSNSTNYLTGQAPVKFAALQFYELFNWAGGVQRFWVKKINCYKAKGGYGVNMKTPFSQTERWGF